MRGKKVQLDEVVGVAAVRGKGHAASDWGPLEQIAPELAIPSIRAFEAAGWSIVPRKAAIDGAKIYLRSNGRAALGTDRVTVRISENRSDQEGRNLLSSRGFTVVERLKLASNLYSVTIPPGIDCLEAAQSLATADDVEFAEPELIEVISHR